MGVRFATMLLAFGVASAEAQTRIVDLRAVRVVGDSGELDGIAGADDESSGGERDACNRRCLHGGQLWCGLSLLLHEEQGGECGDHSLGS